MVMSLKPASHPAFPSYLVEHGLGQWVKLRLRSSSLHLLSMLGRYIRPPLPDDQLFCRLCLDVEDTAHFLCTCPCLQAARESLVIALRTDSELSHLAGCTALVEEIAQWDPSRCVPLRLESVEDPIGSRAVLSPHSALISLLEPHVLKFFADIWLARAASLGRVPSIGIHGNRLASTLLLQMARTAALLALPIANHEDIGYSRR
jgi:hypothetical protein